MLARINRILRCTLTQIAVLSCAIAFLITPTHTRAEPTKDPNPPNVVIILTDDMGYSDIGAFGSISHDTQNIDSLAIEGQKWTNFYVADSVCTPSRGALLTGRLPIRLGLADEESAPRVLHPGSLGGLPTSEVTIAELLKDAGYRTALIGKWHLGEIPKYRPMNQGFDYFFGTLFSNDDQPLGDWKELILSTDPRTEDWNLSIYRGDEIVIEPANQHEITLLYTEEAVRFIDQNSSTPFFLYLSHNMPHAPIFASETFQGKSKGKRYGDTIEEIDWSVGEIISAIRKNNIEENTIVIFTSDNGPWLVLGESGNAGTAGVFKDGKGTTWEGGMRVPTIFWGPGIIQNGMIADIGSTLDLLPTIAALANIQLPEQLVLDGYNLSDSLSERAASPRKEMFFYRNKDIYAVRFGDFKAHYSTNTAYDKSAVREYHSPPLLFNLNTDPSEQENIAEKHPEIIERIDELMQNHTDTMIPGESQLNLYP